MYLVPKNEFKKWNITESQVKEYFDVTFDKVTMKQSFLNKIEKELTRFEWKVVYIQMGECARFEDLDYMRSIVKKEIPVAIKANGEIALHDLVNHLVPAYRQALDSNFEFFDNLNNIINKPGSELEKLVDALAFEVSTVCYAIKADMTMAELFELFETETFVKMKNSEFSGSYSKRFQENMNYMSQSMNFIKILKVV